VDVPGPDALNALSASAFAVALAPLFEGASRFLRRVAGARPFESDAAMLGAARVIAAAAPEDELIELLDAHPRIGADPTEMSRQSRAEQEDGDIAITSLTSELEGLNDAYEARFGFRYVIFVAGRPRAAIVPLLRAALANDRRAELGRGVADAISIAEERLRGGRAASRGPQEVRS